MGKDRQGARYRPGTIEHHLDMYEGGPLRGDEVSHEHGKENTDPDDEVDSDPKILGVDEMMVNFQEDMSEIDREGDEYSGDDHSAGLQGTREEHSPGKHIETETPEMTEKDDEAAAS